MHRASCLQAFRIYIRQARPLRPPFTITECQRKLYNVIFGTRTLIPLFGILPISQRSRSA